MKKTVRECPEERQMGSNRHYSSLLLPATSFARKKMVKLIKLAFYEQGPHLITSPKCHLISKKPASIQQKPVAASYNIKTTVHLGNSQLVQ